MPAGQRTLPESGRQDDLARELRALRNRSGLTLAALADRTCYSKSSWERYLNGKSLPPEPALKAFAHAVGVGPGRLLVLRSLVEEGEEDRARERAPEPGAETTDDPAGAEEAATARPDGLVPRRPDVPERIKPAFLATILPTAAPAPGGRPRKKAPAFFLTLGLLVGLALGFGAAVLFHPDATDTGPSASPDAGQAPRNPVAGCVGNECKGKDPERFDCHQKAWTAATRRIDGVYVQLRYSPTCQAAWGRIVLADVGDEAIVEGTEGHTARRTITYGHDVYTAMVEAPYPASARACAELASAGRVCTDPGAASPASSAPSPRASGPGH